METEISWGRNRLRLKDQIIPTLAENFKEAVEKGEEVFDYKWLFKAYEIKYDSSKLKQVRRKHAFNELLVARRKRYRADLRRIKKSRQM